MIGKHLVDSSSPKHSLYTPSIPVLYYGDESGLAGANDPDNRRPYWPLGADASNLAMLEQSALRGFLDLVAYAAASTA